MAKRGRKPKARNIFQALDPRATREIFGVIVAALAIILILAEFNAAGQAGRFLLSQSVVFFGWVGYLVPFWLALASYYFFSDKVSDKVKKAFYGTFVLIFLLSTFIAPFSSSGNVVGVNLFDALTSIIGKIGGFIVLIALIIIGLIVSFNFSLGELFLRVPISDSSDQNKKRFGASSIFTMVRRRIGALSLRRAARAKPNPQIPVYSAVDNTWELPPIDLLEFSTSRAQAGNIAKNVEIIKKTLADFSIPVEMGDVNIGPTITQYEVKPNEGVKLNTIVARSDDLALALAQHPVRIEAPIPGKSAVGVEVPNKAPARVTLREIIESENFKKRPGNLSLGLGCDVSGTEIIVNLAEMPHLLIAGATGSGKSMCLNSVLIALLYQNSPRDLKLLLVDPKRVEFTCYDGIPHLLAPVVVDVEKTINLLKWATSEMERRFKVFAEIGARNIEAYNSSIKSRQSDGGGMAHEKMPYIVIIIDELADLMAQASNEVEAAIVRIAQLARATGIHLIVATQRPSVDVITGLIKANITSRVAFAVASQVDSRTIIDQAGADKLLGNGDMLFIGGKFSKPKRIQGTYVSDKETNTVANFLKRNGKAIYDPSILEYKASSISGRSSGDFGNDPIYQEAKELVVQSGTGSASFLQRRLSVGYARAARLLDMMEEEGIVGPSKGAKPRDILVDSIEASDSSGEAERHIEPEGNEFRSRTLNQDSGAPDEAGTGYNKSDDSLGRKY